MATVAGEAAAAEEGTSPLVAVTFQRNANRKQKYLEAEPKALGITQIGLSVFQITCLGVFLAKDLSRSEGDIAFFVSSLLVIIAGSVAVAAQNLHVPTLKACLGMEVVACGASIFNMICSLVKMDYMPSYCWHYYYDNVTLHYRETCRNIESTHSHFYAESVVIQVALLAISATLAIYCCKVVNCCAPAPKMPVITVQTPPAQQ
ncbi:membrane-spanning 4-domains subfamily A member 4A-like [Enoplosus armatus]|uniref:membrane-spanning 4-domains subfamily A member 4A-like n=1 Tax=Enoplosus armatus TaxID=215367 RepID=UPI0039945474